ncbi:MAG: Na+/H+ antiporter subunit C [Kiloniellaceae bacterium]|nr:Na+/H+ antiporter subunit C [Kiloniellaceae bacterium]
MEFLVASGVGAMTAAGVYLLLRGRTFPVIIGLALLSYAINVFLFATGRLVINRPPVIAADAAGYTDPLPQALVLTAIVISFGMTALIVVLALRAYLEAGSDAVDTEEATVEPAASHDTRPGLPRDGDAA